MSLEVLDKCILTGARINPPKEIESVSGRVIEYENTIVGKVKIAVPTAISLIRNQKFNNYRLAGICRHAFEKKEEPPIITTALLESDDFDVPSSFERRWRYMLEYMFINGADEYRLFDFMCHRDYPLCHCESPEEFGRVLDCLEDKYFVTIQKKTDRADGRWYFHKVGLTDIGREEVGKTLPKMPMIGLINDDIQTGDFEIDEKINHAKKLFFQEPQNLDNMRSACETLSYVLEPLRKELKSHFSSKDVNDFFDIVNNFDIRHNKERTKSLELPEQLEWVFYTLLNTINTYIKIKSRE